MKNKNRKVKNRNRKVKNKNRKVKNKNEIAMWLFWSGREAQKGHKMQNDEVKIKTLKTKSETDKIKTKTETEKHKIEDKNGKVKNENRNVKNKSRKVKNKNKIAMWPFWASVMEGAFVKQNVLQRRVSKLLNKPPYGGQNQTNRRYMFIKTSAMKS